MLFCYSVSKETYLLTQMFLSGFYSEVCSGLCYVSDFGTERRLDSHASVEGRSNARVVERITRISITCSGKGDGKQFGESPFFKSSC